MINSQFKEKLKEMGCKLTVQRRWIFDIILENQDKHLTTEEIYSQVKKKHPEIGLATVYRTMQLFEEMGIIDRINFDDGFSRFELNVNGENHHHHHLICEKCSKVFEVADDLLTEIENEIEQKYKFKVKNHNVLFYGYCEECAKNKK